MADIFDSWLEGIGVNLSRAAAPEEAAKPKYLTDADFPTDLKQRKRVDEEIRRKAQKNAQAEESEPGEGPPEEDDSLVDAVTDKAKELFDAAREKLKLPGFSKEEDKKIEDATPLVRLFKDLESGTKMYAKYVEYIKKALDQAAKYGDLAGASRIVEASQGMSKIAGQIKGRLGQAGGLISKARKMVEWIEAAGAFADASRNMKAGEIESVEHWIGSLKDLWDATLPFKEELEDKWWEAALAESEAALVAAPAMATLAIVGSQLYVGINLLEQGVKNEKAYFERLRKETQDSDQLAAAAQREPLPEYPGEWKTSEEEEQEAARIDEANRQMADRSARQRKIQEATEEFELHVFPALYEANRKAIRRQINAAVQSTGGSPATDWSDCLMPSGEQHDDEKLGITLYGSKENAAPEDIPTEIGNFQGVRPPCPFFQKLHDDALKKHLAKAGKDRP